MKPQNLDLMCQSPEIRGVDEKSIEKLAELERGVSRVEGLIAEIKNAFAIIETQNKSQ